MIIDAFKNKIFPTAPTGFQGDVDEDELLKKHHEKDSKLPAIEEEPEDEISDISGLEQINRLDKFYGSGLINKYFKETSLIKIINQLKITEKKPKTHQKYINLMVHLIIGLEKLKEEIENMSKDAVGNKKFGYLKDLVRKIVDANQKLDEMSDLETEESATERQQGQGLKILTPQQMIATLPILLAQLKAGNNSKKLKNEIRQLLYSLYRSKNLSKTIYNSLMNTI